MRIAAVVVVVGLLAAAWVTARTTRSPDQAAADAAPPEASWVTAPVERRVLSRTVITRGDVRPEITVGAAVPVSVEGDPVVTRLLVTVGDRVREGDRLVEVSGRPVFVMTGEVPIYRTLRPGMRGADVAALQAALGRLGFAPETDGLYGPATKVAVTAFYEDAGYSPIGASTTEAPDLAAAEQAVSDADAAVLAAQRALDESRAGAPDSAIAQAESDRNSAQRVLDDAEAAQASQVALARQAYDLAVRERDQTSGTAADRAQLAVDQAMVQLDDTIRTTQHAVDAATEALSISTLALDEIRASTDTTETQDTFNSAVEARDRAVAARDQLVAVSGPTVPQGEIVFAPSLPARVRSAVGALGALGGPLAGENGEAAPGYLVELAAGRLVVDVTLRPSEAGLIQPGLDVELLDEQTNVTYAATAEAVAADPVVGADGQVGYPAILAPDDPLPDRLTGSNLRVTVTEASTDTASLVVPVAAISSAADGSTFVQILYRSGTPVAIPVETGLSADGWVAVASSAPGELSEGDEVVVGR